MSHHTAMIGIYTDQVSIDNVPALFYLNLEYDYDFGWIVNSAQLVHVLLGGNPVAAHTLQAVFGLSDRDIDAIEVQEAEAAQEAYDRGDMDAEPDSVGEHLEYRGAAQ